MTEPRSKRRVLPLVFIVKYYIIETLILFYASLQEVCRLLFTLRFSHLFLIFSFSKTVNVELGL